jgi:hypothetical protein
MVSMQQPAASHRCNQLSTLRLPRTQEGSALLGQLAVLEHCNVCCSLKFVEALSVVKLMCC